MAAPTTDRPEVGLDDPFDVATEAQASDSVSAASPAAPGAGLDSDEEDTSAPIAYRPLIAAALACSSAGLVTGGIFGVWSARLLGMFAAIFGVFWAWLALRSPKRAALLQGLLVPAALVLGIIALIPTSGGGPSKLPKLVADAVTSGRLLRPPVPFDPGWRPILLVVLSLLGFGAAWVGTALDRPRLALAVPLPVLALTAITQPANGEFIAGLCAFIPLVGALAVLFGGDATRAAELTSQFELKRAVRGVVATAAGIVALVLLSNSSFLFPKPVYNPADKPQKPKAIPLSASNDRVLFEIKTGSSITGPWKTGVLDVYDGTTWRLPPFDPKRLKPVPGDGVVNARLAGSASATVQFTIRDLGNSATLPATATPAKLEPPAGTTVNYDPRTETFRVPSGRVPADVTYSVSLPPYPDAVSLQASPPAKGLPAEYLFVPPAPPAVARLISEAPPNAWDRLEFVRKRLQEVAVAVGGGVPKDVPAEKVVDLLDGKHEGSPFELVAAEAMLARWVGVPSRIGYGFDGVNDENGVLTVRPKNAAQWLEAYFEGHGWVPLIGAPPKAKSQLDNDPNARFNPTTLPSDEVAVEVYVALEARNLKLLYQKIREQLVLALPYVLALVALYLAWPSAMKALRRRKRRRWADHLGPRAQIAVEYAEFRDLAHDLNLGDPYDTSLEYLKRVIDDPEHQELAWLVARSMYGDLAAVVTDDEARSAEELAASLRRRLFRGQPFQSRVLAVLSKASLRHPYSTEVPNVRQLDPWRRLSDQLARMRRSRKRRPGRRLWGRLPMPALPGRR